MSDPFSRTQRISLGRAVPPPAEGRPLATAAALAGALTAGVGLVICFSLALTAWFLADAGAHGNTTDALRAGADAWLMGHGSRLELAGLPLGMTPLALTMALLLASFRGGQWAARHSAGTEEDRALGVAVAAFAGVYVVIAVLVCVIATQTGATPGLGRTVLGALVVSVVAGGCGMASTTGRLEAWIDRLPEWATEIAAGALLGTLTLVLAGAVLVATSLLFSFNEASSVMSSLDLSTGDAVTFTFVMALAAPNAVLLGCSYLLGPGFAFGVGTTVSPQAVSLGAVPAVPVLAALPDDGPTAGWLVALLVVPSVCAAVGVVRSRRRAEPLPLDIAALRGAAAGFGAAVVITIAIALAGGPLGTGRLAHIGAPTASVLGYASVAMSLGGLIGGLAQAWWRRRRG